MQSTMANNARPHALVPFNRGSNACIKMRTAPTWRIMSTTPAIRYHGSPASMPKRSGVLSSTASDVHRPWAIWYCSTIRSHNRSLPPFRA